MGTLLSSQPRAYLLSSAHIFTKSHFDLHIRVSEVSGNAMDDDGYSRVSSAGNYPTDPRKAEAALVSLLSKVLK